MSVIITTCCGKCGCPITSDELYKEHKGIPEHIECPNQVNKSPSERAVE